MDKNIALNFSKYDFNKYIMYIFFGLYTIFAFIFIHARKISLVMRFCETLFAWYSMVFGLEPRRYLLFLLYNLYFLCYNISEKTCLQGLSSAIFQRKRRFGEDKAHGNGSCRQNSILSRFYVIITIHIKAVY